MTNRSDTIADRHPFCSTASAGRQARTARKDEGQSEGHAHHNLRLLPSPARPKTQPGEGDDELRELIHSLHIPRQGNRAPDELPPAA